MSITSRVRPYGARMASAQSHRPLVQGLTVGPTPKPFGLLRMTLLSR